MTKRPHSISGKPRHTLDHTDLANVVGGIQPQPIPPGVAERSLPGSDHAPALGLIRAGATRHA